MKFLKVKVDEDMIDRAKLFASEIPNSKHVFMPYERHVVGFIGEEIVKKVFPMVSKSKNRDKYYFDYMLGGQKIEIKTKMCKSIPNENYDCSIYNYFNQNPNYYMFCRVIKKNGGFPHGWVLGYISKKEFDEKKVFVPKNTAQPNGFTTRVDTWNILIKDLKPIHDLVKKSKGEL